MPPRKSKALSIARNLVQAVAAPYPGFIEPARPNLKKIAPSGDRWFHEIKWDGYRMQLHLIDRRPKIFSRPGNDWTERFPSIAATLPQLLATTVILDGEMIVPNERAGDFNAMQNSVGPKSRTQATNVQFQAFDILYLDGIDLRNCRLIDRKAVMEELLDDAPGCFRIVERIEGQPGSKVYQSACALRLEGIVSKLADAPYRSGDRTDWVKVKCIQRAKLVVVGYVPQTGGTVAALRLARRDGDQLVYAGKVGTGFSAKSGAEVRAKLEPLMRKAAALAKPLKKPDTVWVEPRFEADVEFLEETEDGLRHGSFKGMAER